MSLGRVDGKTFDRRHIVVAHELDGAKVGWIVVGLAQVVLIVQSPQVHLVIVAPERQGQNVVNDPPIRVFLAIFVAHYQRAASIEAKDSGIQAFDFASPVPQIV